MLRLVLTRMLKDETESAIVDENRLMWKIAKEQKKGGAELGKTGPPSSLPGRKGYQGEHIAEVSYQLKLYSLFVL